VFVEDSAGADAFNSRAVRMINQSDSLATVKIKTLHSNIDSLSWHRSIQTHLITYPPGQDSVTFELAAMDSGIVLFVYYLWEAESRTGCIEELFEISTNGPFRSRDSITVIACSRSPLTALEEQAAVSIYPNPVKSSIHLTGLPNQIGTFEITDLLGRSQMKNTLTDQIDVSELKNGIYFLLLQTEKQDVAKRLKFVKSVL